MRDTITLNGKLYRSLLSQFKPELRYFNRSGVLHWICESCEFVRHRSSIMQLEEELTLFETQVDRFGATVKVSFEPIYREEKRFLESAVKILKEAGYSPALRTTAVNYMMFHLLVEAGAIEFEEGIGLENFYNEEQEVGVKLEDESGPPEDRKVIL